MNEKNKPLEEAVPDWFSELEFTDDQPSAASSEVEVNINSAQVVEEPVENISETNVFSDQPVEDLPVLEALELPILQPISPEPIAEPETVDMSFLADPMESIAAEEPESAAQPVDMPVEEAEVQPAPGLEDTIVVPLPVDNTQDIFAQLKSQLSQPSDEESLLAVPDSATEILPDESALADHGLQDMKDAELESIMREAMSDDWLTPGAAIETPLTHEEPQEETVVPVLPPEEFKDQEFRHAFGEGKELESVFAPPPPPETPAAESVKEDVPAVPKKPTVRKIRPRRKKGAGLLGIPHLLVTGVWLAIILFIGVTVGRLVWLCADDMLALTRQHNLVTVTITEEDTLEDIAKKLKDGGLIKYESLFVFYGEISDLMEDIDPGIYQLDAIYDYMALKNHMKKSTLLETVDVVIPEGYTCKQIFKLLEEKGVCSAAELSAYAAAGDLGDYWFLEYVERGSDNCLEGFLFPDTYQFYKNATPKHALGKMLDGFDNKFSETMIASIKSLNKTLSSMMKKNGYKQSAIDNAQLDLRDIVIVASLIERESSGEVESYKVSSVIYNRLADPKDFPYLEIDACIFYVLPEHKDALSAADLKLDNPYNTYLYKGLPPGPISNPGLDSLRAALNPDDTDYFFYALNPKTGTHKFSKTYKEHKAFLDSLKK